MMKFSVSSFHTTLVLTLCCAVINGQNSDVKVTSFSKTISSAKFYDDVDFKLYFTVAFGNIQDNIVAATGTVMNFDVEILITDADVSAAQSNTLGINPFPGVINPQDVTKLQSALASTDNPITLGGHTMLNIPAAKHDSIQFVCIHVKKGTSAPYTDTDSNNNYNCINIVSEKAKKADTLDLSIMYYKPVNHTVTINTFVSLDLHMKVKLFGSTTLDPATKPYSVHAYLSLDDQLNTATDLQLTEVPLEFAKVSSTSFPASPGYLDLSGPGLRIPNNTMYCGPVYLIIFLDGQGGVPGQIPETNEENNIMAERLVILCPGDYFALHDLSFDLGVYQEELYVEANTPIYVSANVFNVDPEGRPFQPGPANFNLMIYLHQFTDLSQGSPIDVTSPGMTFYGTGTSQTGVPAGKSVAIKNAKLFVDGTKFTDFNNINYLILKVIPADGSTAVDTVMGNNYAAVPIPVSNKIKNEQVEFIVDPTFTIRQNVASGKVIMADGSILLKSDLNSNDNKKPNAGDTLSFQVLGSDGNPTGHVTYPSATNLGSMRTNMYFSRNSVLEPSDDYIVPQAMTTLSMETYSGRFLIKASSTQNFGEPTDKNLCGVIYVFIRTYLSGASWESLEYNNIGQDMVRLQCNSADTLGLTDAAITHPLPYIWAGTSTTLSLSVDVSCTKNPCTFTGVQKTFQMKLYLDDKQGNKKKIKDIVDNTKMAEVTNNGLNVKLDLANNYRQTINFDVDVTIAAGDCIATGGYLGIELLKADGSADGYTDNDYITLPLPDMECSTTTAAIDLSVKTFTLNPETGTVLHPGQRIPYTLEADLVLENSATLPDKGMPQFQLSVSLQDATSGLTMEIPYALTDCQVEQLTKPFSAASTTISLDDTRGFIIPATGFENFCASTSLNVVVSLDSYDLDPNDKQVGQLREKQETNNIKRATNGVFTLYKTVMDCSQFIDTSSPKLVTAVISFKGPEIVFPGHGLTYEIELAVINAYTKPIRGGSAGFQDFSIKAYLAGDYNRTAAYQHFVVSVLSHHETFLYTGMEAGGRHIFQLTAKLCQSKDAGAGCTESNVLEQDTECPALVKLEPQILFGVSQIRQELTAAGYSAQDPLFSHKVTVMCKKRTMHPSVIKISVPKLLMRDSTYEIPFVVNITNFAPGTSNPSNLFNGAAAKFELNLWLSKDGTTEDIQLTVTNDIQKWPNLVSGMGIGESITLTGKAALDFSDNSKCIALKSGMFMRAKVVNLATALTNLGYFGGSFELQDTDFTSNYSVDCSNNFIDVSIKDFSLTNSTISFDSKNAYTLTTNIEPSGSVKFAAGSTKNYDVKFYISYDSIYSSDDKEIPSPFQASSTDKMKKAVTSNTDHTLSSSGPTDELVLSAAVGGHYCFQRIVYIIVMTSVIDQAKTDSDSFNDEKAVQVNLNCEGDLFMIESATVQSKALMQHSGLEIQMDITVVNSHPSQIAIPPSANGRDLFYFQLYAGSSSPTLIELQSMEISSTDQAKLKQTIPANGKLMLKGLKFLAKIDGTACTKINSETQFSVRGRYGLGIEFGFVDTIPENNEFKFTSASCSADTADLSVTSFAAQGGVTPQGGKFGKQNFNLEINLALSGTRTFSSGSTRHFEFRVFLSHDNILDIKQDKELPLTMSNYDSKLTAAYGTAGNNAIQITATGIQGLIYPLDIKENYCGRSFLIIWVDSNNDITETVESNNQKASQVFLNCENDLYDLKEVTVHSQQKYFPDIAAPFEFSASVFNVRKTTSQIPSASTPNYQFRIFAQFGSEYNAKYATDIASSNWTVKAAESANFLAQFPQNQNHMYTNVRGDITISSNLCELGVDHLVVLVENVAGNSLTECLVYNNYFAFPISCGGADSVDVRLEMDRLNNPIFELIGDKSITLGTLKPFNLKLEIDVKGNGGWQAQSSSADPVFNYEFVFIDDLTSSNPKTITLPYVINKAEINKRTTVTRKIDLGGTFNLTIADFLPFCQTVLPNLGLRVNLDTGNKLVESNELNNELTISQVTLSDGGSGTCSSGTDLIAKTIELTPYGPTLEIQIGTSFTTKFTYTSTGSADFKYQLILSEDGTATNPTNYVNTSLETAHTHASGTTVNVPAATIPQSDPAAQRFCSQKAYIGVMVDSGQTVAEVNERNNYVWRQIFITCPGITAIAVLSFSLDPTNVLQDSTALTFKFNTEIINKGQDIAKAGSGVNFNLVLYLSSSMDRATVIGGTALATTASSITGADSPGRGDKFRAGNVWKYTAATATFTMPANECVGKQYMCLSLEPVGLSEYDGDNIQCVDVLTGPVVLDCARDLALSSVSYDMNTTQIFQDTAVPLTFTTQMTYIGRSIPASTDGTSHFKFKVYISDTMDKTPTTLGGGGTPLLINGHAKDDFMFSGAFTNSQIIPIIYETSVKVSSALCASTNRYLCVEYVWMTQLIPAFREGNLTNDISCVDVSAVMGCHGNTKDINPVWLEFDHDGIIRANDMVYFDLLVKIDLRGEGTEGPLPFNSTFFVSTSDKLDQTAVELPYTGLEFSKPSEEMSKYLRVGVHSMNLGGVSINISINTDTHSQFCGAAYILFQADSDYLIAERYEDNNVISSPVVIQCPGDYLGISVKNFMAPDGVWAEANNSYVKFDWTIPRRSISPEQVKDMTSDPSYEFEVYASDSASWGSGSQTLVGSQSSRNCGTCRSKDVVMDNSLNPAKANMLHGVTVYLDGSLFTSPVCSSMTHMFVCVKYLKQTEATSFMSNNCQMQPITAAQKKCTGQASQTDLELVTTRIPEVITVPSQILVQHDIRVSVGSAALPLKAGDFISTLYLSKSKVWNKMEAFKVIDVPNIIDQAVGDNSIKKVTNEKLSIPVPADKSYCGHMYAFIMVDSAEDVMESSESNNVGYQEIDVVCPGDYFSLSNVHLDIPEGHLVEGVATDVSLFADVTLTCSNCSVPVSTTANNIMLTLSSGSHTYDIGQNSILPEADTQSLLRDLMANRKSTSRMFSGYDVEDFAVSSHSWFGVGYINLQTRHFAILGKQLKMPDGQCSGGMANFTVTLGIGSVVTGITDTVPENQQVTLTVKCQAGSTMDLVAHSTELLSKSTTTNSSTISTDATALNSKTPCVLCAEDLVTPSTPSSSSSVITTTSKTSWTDHSSPSVFMSTGVTSNQNASFAYVSYVAESGDTTGIGKYKYTMLDSAGDEDDEGAGGNYVYSVMSNRKTAPKAKFGVDMPEQYHIFDQKIELVGDSINSIDALPRSSPLVMEFYISMDAVLSYDDVALNYSLSHSVASDLRNGLVGNTSVNVKEIIQGIRVPNGMCGYWYIIVYIDNSNRIEESAETNNFAATKVFVDCETDLYEMVDFNLNQPQTAVYPNRQREVSVNVALRYNSVKGAKGDGKPMYELRGYLSTDEKWDPLMDTLQALPNVTAHIDLLQKPLSTGDYRIFSDLSFLVSMTTEDCTNNKRYLILVVLPLGSQATAEKVLRNNWRSQPLNAQCTGAADVSATLQLQQGKQERGKATDVTINLNIAGTLPAPLTNGDITIDLYYSQDIHLDPVVDVFAPFVPGPGGLKIPADVPLYLCGKIYVLAVLDAKNIIPEIDETNNVVSAPFTILCNQQNAQVEDTFNMLDLSVTGQLTGADVGSPVPLSMSVKVVCTRIDGTCPAAPSNPNQGHYGFKVKVYDSGQFELGSMSPSILDTAWAAAVTGDSDDFTSLTENDGLRKSFSGSIKEWPLVIQDKFQLANPEMCERVKYLGLELIKGDSAEMASKSLGPPEANTRMVPFTMDCRRSTIDIALSTFAIDGKILNLTVGSFMLQSLMVDITVKNMPPNFYNRSLFDYTFYISGENSATASGDSFGTMIPKSVQDLLSGSRTTKQLNLKQTAAEVTFEAMNLRQYCGKTAYVKAVLDPYDDVKETNEANNILVEEVTVTGCPEGGIDQKIMSMKSPSVVMPDALQFTVDLSVKTVIIGQVGVIVINDPTAERYSVNFDLVDNVENPKKVVPLNVDMSQFNLLKQDLLPDKTDITQIGIATVHDQQLSGITINIPPDLAVCGTSWFLRARAINTTLEMDKMDNYRYEHLYVVCPDDQLALLGVEVVYMPNDWWSESTNEIQLYTSVINVGADISNGINTLYKVKQYFSVDDVLDTQTDSEMPLVDSIGHRYEEFGSITNYQVKRSGLLKGELKMATEAVCNSAKAANAKPTIFWVLVPSDATWTNNTGNDVMKIAVDKNTLKCNPDNVDLMVHEVDMNTTIVAGEAVSFVLHIRQTKTATAIIAKSNFESKDVSYKFEFYLSNDETFGTDDVLVDFTYDAKQLDTLQQGITDVTEEFIPIRGDNLMLDPVTHPQYAFHCGQTNLITKVTDVKHINNPIDPVPENNFFAKPIILECTKDVISFESLELRPVFPQKQLYHSTETKFNMNAKLKSYSTEKLNNSMDSRYVFEFRAFMSVDAVLDVQRDPEIVIKLPSTMRNQFKQGFAAEETKMFQGEVTINVHEVVCSYSPKYLIMLIQKWSQFNLEEDIVSNNYQYIPTSGLFNCESTKGDLWIDKFNFTSGFTYMPGSTVNFDFIVKAKLFGKTLLGIAGVLDVSLSYFMQLDYQFYLSTDTVYDKHDESLNYDKTTHPYVQDMIKSLLGNSYVVVANPFFTLGGSLTIPKTMGSQYCGHVYILAVVDPNYIANEINEHNNVNPVPLVIKCHNDVFELASANAFSPQSLYYKGEGQLRMFLNVHSLLSKDITPEADSDYGKLQLYVKSSNYYGVDFAVTPKEIYNFADSPQDFSTETLTGNKEKVFGILKAFFAMQSACDANRNPVETGKTEVQIEFNRGNNTQLDQLADSVPFNNMFETTLSVTCTPVMIDLSVKDTQIHGKKFGPSSNAKLKFGNNPLKLVVEAQVHGGAGWDIGPSGPTDPVQFTYNFEYQVMTLTWGPSKTPYVITGKIQFDAQAVKSTINANTRNTRDIDLSDSNMGWYLPRKEYLFLCLIKETDNIFVILTLDDSNQISEMNEGNNLQTVLVNRPADSECTPAIDISPSSFKIKETEFDIVKTDTNQKYELKIMLVLVGNVFNKLQASDPRQHFHAKVLMSFDQLLDSNDIVIDIPWTSAQIEAFKMHAIDLDFMDLSESNLRIPLNNMTYPYCWKHVYLLVQADNLNEQIEENEDNNILALSIILDCGSEVDECTLNYDNCHPNAKCVDNQFNLYTQGQGFECECKPGYKGNGTFCENIDECKQNSTNGSPLHNCGTISNSHCIDLIGSFQCACNPGYAGNGVCVNFNECENSTLNKCDPNAVCSDNIGSYTCQCKTGFQGDGWNCTNVNDCKADSCKNGGVCKDAVQSVECLCADYYEGDHCEIANGNWGTWSQWSDCLSDCGMSIRSRARQCDNPAPTDAALVKGRPCLTDSTGVGNIEYGNCTKGPCSSTFNWCENDPCNKAAGGLCILTNSGSSFRCECMQGFNRLPAVGEFQRCVDIDECIKDKHDCSILASCTNTVGSYKCTCSPGYTGNGKICEDINECSTGLQKCDINAQCINKPLLYDCQCNDGYKKEKVGDPVLGKCVVKRLFDYGSQYGDLLVTSKSYVTGERVSPLIPVPDGLPMAGGTICNSLYLSENGLIVGTMEKIQDFNRDTYRFPKHLDTFTFSPTGNNKALIAPLWADVENENTSQVWYQSYTDRSNPMFSKVEQKLRETANVTIPMRFILKATWQQMKPTYNSSGNKEVNTFQAVIATDYTKSYVIFIYEAKGMTWNPVYTASEIQIKYNGYPAWIGYTSIKADGTMYRPPQNINSGKWSTDPSQPNAYRVESKVMQSHGQMGVITYRMDTNTDPNMDYFNPRKACHDWYNSEPAPSVWGSTLVGSCPSIQNQVDEDMRFILDNKPGQTNNCFTLRFALDSGPTVRCCYASQTGSLITAKDTNNGATLTAHDQIGFVTRYPKSTSVNSTYYKKDIMPFTWCCLEAKNYSSSYCDMYLEKRPIATAEKYDSLQLAHIHGDPHFTTMDGYSYTYNGFGEYVMISGDKNAPVYVELQARTAFIDMKTFLDDPTATKLSGIAIQVGSSSAPKIQVYLKPIQNQVEIEVYVDGNKYSSSSPLSTPGIYIQQESGNVPTWAKIAFKEGIWLKLESQLVKDQELMKVIFAVPSSLQGKGYSGLWGSYDGNMENDMVNFIGLNVVPKASEATDDHIIIWGNTWNLPTVYGQSSNPPNANTKTLFTKYTHPNNLYSSAILYYNISYTPRIYKDSDFTSAQRQTCADGGTWSKECLYDYNATGHAEVGLQAIANKNIFDQLNVKLTNVAPHFTSATPVKLHLKLDQSHTLSVEVADANHPAGSTSLPDITLQVSIKNSASAEMLSSTSPTVTKNPAAGTYTSSFDWRPMVADKYTAEFHVKDQQAATSTVKPFIVLCACQNDGVCDYVNPWGIEETFAYAGCVCPAGRTGKFCEGDLNGCTDAPCYGSCTDRSPNQINPNGREYTCGPCPAGMEGDGETCSDINQCLRPVGDTNRHKCNQTCTNTAVDNGYVCSCGPGFILNADGKGCDDIQECRKSTDNNCDHIHGKCLETPPGSYTCDCNPGYVMDPVTKKCVDQNECETNNGGCERKCINAVGSFTCECGVGFKLKPEDTTKTKCIEINECDFEPECDQNCVDKIGFYECTCRSAYTLASDGMRCMPKEGCQTLKCHPNTGTNVAYCGVSDVTGTEQCFCPHGYQITPGNQTSCSDVNECTQNKQSCDVNAVCNNTIGGYTCHCKHGFKADAIDKKRCNDFDECTLGKTVTGCEQLCINNYGSYSCGCQNGYTLNSDGKTCKDIDECTPGQTNLCSPLADCVNTNGSYNCLCKAGFQGTGDVCNDINECQTTNTAHQHNCQMACTNTYGSFRCTCVAGYKVSPTDPTKCIDLNECVSPGKMCTQLCTNTDGSFTCGCESGFQLAADKHTCQAVTGCEEQCGGGVCQKLNGIKKCVCKYGYSKGTFNLDECLDINECSKKTDTCDTTQQAVCENRPVPAVDPATGYICKCNIGYTLNEDNITCRDINECELTVKNADSCDVVSTVCVNNPGGKTCACNKGFQPHNATHCQDNDECTMRTHDCMRKKAQCINTPGTYKCKCIAGYQGNGKVCIDVNECDVPEYNNCDVNTQQCMNTVGSYYCKCKNGYKMDPTNNQCVDINECNSPILNKCENKPGCINQVGGYRCSCYQGAVLAADGFACLVTSKCQNPSTCDRICVRLDNKDSCPCRYPYEMQNSKCTDINECTQTVYGAQKNPCDESHSVCVDKPAGQGFECQCIKPWLMDIDGRGCSETNGLWSQWSDFSTCSKSCNGRKERTRSCSAPPPRGFNRTCPGQPIEYQMCNVDSCVVDKAEVQVGVDVTFSLLDVVHWETVSPAFGKGLALSISRYCRRTNITYQECCKKEILQENMPTKGDLVTVNDLRVADGYPVTHSNNGTKVMIYFEVQDANTLCPKSSNSGARKRRSLDDEDFEDDDGWEGFHRSKRALNVSPNSTFSVLDQGTLQTVLNENNTKTRISEFLDDENKLENYGPGALSYLSSPGSVPTTTTKAPPVVVEAGGGLPMWAIVVICIVMLIVFVAVMVTLLIVTKRLKKSEDEAKLEESSVSRPESAISRVDMANADESNLGSRSSLSTSLTGSHLSLREDADLDNAYMSGYATDRTVPTARSDRRQRKDSEPTVWGDETHRTYQDDEPDEESMMDYRPVSQMTMSMGPTPVPQQSRPGSELPGAVDHDEDEDDNDGSDNPDTGTTAVAAGGAGVVNNGDKKKKKKKKKKPKEKEPEPEPDIEEPEAAPVKKRRKKPQLPSY